MCNSMKIFIVLIICCTSSIFCFSQNVKTKQGLSIKIDTIGVFREGPNNLRVFNVHLTLQNTTSKNALLWFDKCEISDSLSFRNKFILINGDWTRFSYGYDELVLDEKNIKP